MRHCGIASSEIEGVFSIDDGSSISQDSYYSDRCLSFRRLSAH